MSVPTLAHPGPDHSRGPRSRALRTCPDAPPPGRRPVVEAPPATRAGTSTTRGPAPARLAPVALLIARWTAAAWIRVSARGHAAYRAVLREDRGMSTVEYAIGTVAAAAFGVVLYTVVSGDSVVTALTGLVQRALQIEF